MFIAVEAHYLLKCVRCVEEELKLSEVEWVFQGPVEHCSSDVEKFSPHRGEKKRKGNHGGVRALLICTTFREYVFRGGGGSLSIPGSLKVPEYLCMTSSVCQRKARIVSGEVCQ